MTNLVIIQASGFLSALNEIAHRMISVNTFRPAPDNEQRFQNKVSARLGKRKDITKR